MEVSKDTRILIIEGIAGAGKSTFHDMLVEQLRSQGKKIYEFLEEELMLGWKHIHVPGLSDLRLDFANKLLDYIEEKLEKDSEIIFILHRFHISIRILEWEFNRGFEKRYKALLDRLNGLPVEMLVPVLDEQSIKERSSHKERDEQWKQYLKEKLRLRGFSSIEELYIQEQKQILSLLEEQGLPYRTFEVEIN